MHRDITEFSALNNYDIRQMYDAHLRFIERIGLIIGTCISSVGSINVANFFGVSVKTVYRWAKNPNAIPSAFVGYAVTHYSLLIDLTFLYLPDRHTRVLYCQTREEVVEDFNRNRINKEEMAMFQHSNRMLKRGWKPVAYEIDENMNILPRPTEFG